MHLKEKAKATEQHDREEAAKKKKKSTDKPKEHKPKATKSHHDAPTPAPAQAKPAKKEATAAAPAKKTAKPQQHHETKANSEYESYYNYHPKSGKYEYAPHYETTVYDEDDDDEKAYPVYPYQASIYYDVANGYDIVYDPDYESPFDTEHYDQMFLT